ncbi:MAG: DHA2 family efflux MFS transporter permease subunit [Dehalococcoidia bacterium]|nr:DHA2 family efflux MFS transporter permease subunit [Dehalococcoidia bacterium]
MNTPRNAHDLARGRKSLLRPGFVASLQERLQASGRYKWLVVIVVCLTALNSTVEQGMLNVALPMMTAELKTDLTTIQWVVTAQLVIITALLLPSGRLGDFLGRERVFIGGIGVTIIGSALCGVSQSVEQLIFFRVVQGIGGAMILGNHQAIIAGAFPAAELGRAVGMTSTTVGIGYLIGPSLGGFLVDLFGWRPSFYVRVVTGLVGLGIALLVLKSSSRSKGGFKFDLWGALTLGLSTTFLLLAVSQGESKGWSSPQIIMFFAIFFALLLVFVWLEKRIKDPLIDLDVFRYRLFTAASISNFLNFFSLFTVPVLVSFYLVQVAGYPASQVGLILTAQPMMMALAAPFSGWTCDRIDSRYLVTTGIIIACFGLFLLSGSTVQTSPLKIAVELGLIGLGTGLFMSPNVRDIMQSLPRDKIGIAGAFVPLTRNLGSSLSVGVFMALFASRIVAYGGEGSPASGVLAEPAIMVMALRDTFIVAAMVFSLSILASLSRGRRGAARGTKAV